MSSAETVSPAERAPDTTGEGWGEGRGGGGEGREGGGEVGKPTNNEEGIEGGREESKKGGETE